MIEGRFSNLEVEKYLLRLVVTWWNLIIADRKVVVGVGLNTVVHGGCLYFQ